MFARDSLLLLCLLTTPAFPHGSAPADSAAGPVPFRLERADQSFKKSDSSGAVVYILQGAVDVRHGESRILCDSLLYFPSGNWFLCLDSVHLTDPERELRCDSLSYYVERDYYRAAGSVRWSGEGVSGLGRLGEYRRDRGLIRLEGEAAAWDSLRRIDADELEYESNTHVLRALGRVRMLEFASRSTAQAASAVYRKDSGTVLLTGRPEIAYFEKGDSVSPYHLVSDELRRYGPDSVVAVGRVRLWRDSLTVTADSLFHDLRPGVSYFRGGPPLVVDPRFTLRGTTIDVRTAGHKLRRVTALGAARGEFNPDSTAAAPDSAQSSLAPVGSWITGDSLELYFGDSGIDSLSAAGASRSYFRENAQTGVNYILGRRIRLVWESGLIDRVQVEGGGRGLFLQPDSVARSLGRPDSAAAGIDSAQGAGPQIH
ncbi:hypothetical protein LLH00_14395 [bacterium]|nr:hypothetical protein [bacterium]